MEQESSSLRKNRYLLNPKRETSSQNSCRKISDRKYIFDNQICNTPVVIDDRLIEQDYGIYEGVDRQNPDFLTNKRNFAYRYPNGESMMQVASRVYPMIEELKEKYEDKNILLLCHGGVCRVLKTYFQDMTNEEFFKYVLMNAKFEKFTL